MSEVTLKYDSRCDIFSWLYLHNRNIHSYHSYIKQVKGNVLDI